MADDKSPLRGTGPRLISVAEAAEILRVTEKTVLEWIANDQIPYVTLPNGEFCIQLIDESHDGSGPVQSGFLMLAVGGGPDQASRQAFEAELSARRRQAALAGLDFGGLDVDDVAAVLADRLGAVVPDGIYVTQESGMVWIKEAQGHGSGSDVALMLSGEADSTEERVRRAAQDVLDTAQEMISQETTDPWPARAGEVPGGFPRSRAEISSGTVRLFYGRPDAPILELQRISLQSLGRETGSATAAD